MILDDYQNAVESLECYSKLEQHDTVFTETYPEDELVLNCASLMLWSLFANERTLQSHCFKASKLKN